jgi:hypothetical protein
MLAIILAGESRAGSIGMIVSVLCILGSAHPGRRTRLDGTIAPAANGPTARLAGGGTSELAFGDGGPAAPRLTRSTVKMKHAKSTIR